MKERITYIDSAKGICILLVMMIHIGVPEPIPNVYAAKVPLFFILSGFFLRSEDIAIWRTAQKAFKRLLVPFLFFYILSYVVFYLGIYAYPPMRGMTEAQGILDCFNQKQYFNGPLWFLLCLFFVQLIVCAIKNTFHNEWIRVTIFCMMGLTGYTLSYYQIDFPLAMDTTLVAVPMYWIGHYLKVADVFSHQDRWKIVVPLCCVVYIVSIFAPPISE